MSKVNGFELSLVMCCSLFLLSSCAFEMVKTPESIGRELGKLGAETWLRMNPNKGWPSSDGAAMYCAKVVEDVAKENDWDLGKILEATNSCAEGFVEALDNK